MRFLSVSILCVCAGLVLTSCGSRPQSELTYTREVDSSHLEGKALPGALSERIKDQKDREKAAKIRLRRLGKPQEAATMGFGFVGQSNNIFQVFRDGTGFVYPVGKEPIELSKSEPRISKVFLAGPKNQRIIGASHRGSHMSWNGQNFDEQLVLFPQQSTFGRDRAFHIAGAGDASMLVVAMEEGFLRKLSLRSGDVISSTQVKDDQPRRILERTPNRNVIFGTQKGQVSMWSAGRIQKLYAHEGPVLEISASDDASWIVSSSKDGTAIIYHRASDEIVYQTSSSHAIFHTQMSPDGRFAYIEPFRRGRYPILYDTKLRQVHELPSMIGDWPKQVFFDTAAEQVLVLTSQGSVKRLSFDPKQQVTRLNGYSGPRIDKMHYVDGAPYVYWFTKDGQFQTVSATDGVLMSSPFVTDLPISDFDVSYQGRYAVVLFENGQMLRFELSVSKVPQYRFEK